MGRWYMCTRLVNRIANRDGDAVISSCASRDGEIAMFLALRLVILGLFRALSGHINMPPT